LCLIAKGKKRKTQEAAEKSYGDKTVTKKVSRIPKMGEEKKERVASVY